MIVQLAGDHIVGLNVPPLGVTPRLSAHRIAPGFPILSRSVKRLLVLGERGVLHGGLYIVKNRGQIVALEILWDSFIQLGGAGKCWVKIHQFRQRFRLSPMGCRTPRIGDDQRHTSIQFEVRGLSP